MLLGSNPQCPLLQKPRDGDGCLSPGAQGSGKRVESAPGFWSGIEESPVQPVAAPPSSRCAEQQELIGVSGALYQLRYVGRLAEQPNRYGELVRGVESQVLAEGVRGLRVGAPSQEVPALVERLRCSRLGGLWSHRSRRSCRLLNAWRRGRGGRAHGRRR